MEKALIPSLPGVFTTTVSGQQLEQPQLDAQLTWIPLVDKF
jgi:hypothetical protein